MTKEHILDSMFNLVIPTGHGKIEIEYNYEDGEIFDDYYFLYLDNGVFKDITEFSLAMDGLREHGFINEKLDSLLIENAEKKIKEMEEQDKSRAWPLDAFESAKNMYR